MNNEMKVFFRIAGEDNDSWHFGTVINAKKQWVEVSEDDILYPFIADESNIVEVMYENI